MATKDPGRLRRRDRRHTAAIESHAFPEITRGADAILVPVMPSDIDIHATAKCIADLLLVAKIRRSDQRIGIIANRVRANTLVSQSLMRFLNSLEIPLIATLRDTQNYVRSAEAGVGIHEMPQWQVRQDLEHWEQLKGWLETRGRVQPVPAGADSALPSPRRRRAQPRPPIWRTCPPNCDNRASCRSSDRAELVRR